MSPSTTGRLTYWTIDDVVDELITVSNRSDEQVRYDEKRKRFISVQLMSPYYECVVV